MGLLLSRRGWFGGVGSWVASGSLVGHPATNSVSPSSDVYPAAHFVRLQTSPIRGFQYYQRHEILSLMETGDPLSLAAEPLNPFDKRAVRVLWRDQHIGYLPRENNAHVARLLSQQVRLTACIREVRPNCEWRPIVIDIHLSTHPTA
jgi:hypothetical protein